MTIQTCLNSTTNNQYTLRMIAGSITWEKGTWLEVYGVNGNRALKVFMVGRSSESLPFSLYAPINKGEEWKYNVPVDDTWTNVDYSDASWSSFTLASTTQQVTGTQYFRKSFVGLDNLAAIELALYYQYGIVAYINGEEVYRDNMPDGNVLSTTLATSDYSSYDYRGVLRSAAVASNSQSVLAVELHFPDDNSYSLQFDAYLAFYSGVSADNNCYVAPIDFTVSSSSGVKNPAYAVNWSDFSAESSSTTVTATIVLTSQSSIRPMVSAIRIWPSHYTGNNPSSFSVSASNSSEGPFTEVFSTTDGEYIYEKWSEFYRVGETDPYSFFKVVLEEAESTPIYLSEMQFMICNLPSQVSFSYSEPSYSLYVRAQRIDTNPSLYGIHSCTVDPALPSGVSLDPTTCIISGIATVVSPETTYTITSEACSAVGTVTLSFIECESTMYKIVRSYQGSPDFEAFSIRDSVSDDVIMEVPLNNDHAPYSSWTQYFCTDHEYFKVTLQASSYITFWKKDSYLFIYQYTLTDEELVLRARYDSVQGNEDVYYFRSPSIRSSSEWSYKMGEIPSDWYAESASTADWQTGVKGSFPDSANGIQLYRQSFTIASISEVKGVVLSIRYKYGCVVYLNGHEAWRNGVEGDIAVDTIPTNTYEELKYRMVSLPGKTIPTSDSPSVDYLKEGSNTIAIAIVSPSDDLQSYFDAMVRLMPMQSESHIWDFSLDSSSSVNYPMGAFDGFNKNYAYSHLADSYLSLTFNDDRREWISSIEIQSTFTKLEEAVTQLKLYGRNAGEWVLLKNVTGLVFTKIGEKKRIYLNNNTPYNQFKFDGLGTNSGTTSWRVQSLNLYADYVMVEPTELVYPSSYEGLQFIEMTTIVPEGEGYTDFQISPALPAGIHMDNQFGSISGTPTVTSPPTVYEITATKLIGGTVTKTITLSVVTCAVDRSVITFRIYADADPEQNSWKLFAGRGTSGTLINSVDPFPLKEAYYYVSFCLNNGMYTFQGIDSKGDGWSTGSGYTMTVDEGELPLEIEQLPGVFASSSAVSVSTVFSSFLPFQVGYTDWKVYQGEVTEDWNSVSFDDSAWASYKAADIPSSEFTTTYIRKSFELTGIDDYTVMNIRMKYAGGVAVYFNGNRVARFNLEEAYDAFSESISMHDATSFSKFHIILAAAGVVEGTNVVAFEIHRPVGSSSSDPVVFDATGVFGLNDCATVIDSYSQTASSFKEWDLPHILDLDPQTSTTSGGLSTGSIVEWTVENLEGSKWNSFNILCGSTVSRWSFIITNVLDPDDSLVAPLATEFQSKTITSLTKPQLPVPMGMAGYRKMQWKTTGRSSSSYYSSFHVAYCKPTGSVCPGVGNYPPVKEGEISYSSCPSGSYGYSYRTCSNGTLGEVQYDQCIQRPTTAVPTTDAPTTEVPTTIAPTTDIPTTIIPTTIAPTTDIPTTIIPTTTVPTTESPVAPTTESPITPTTEAPVPVIPTTESPVVPTTEAPVTPTTEAPIPPTTESPVTPTTEAPVPLIPTTESPVTPTTESPILPTTEAPIPPTTESPIAPTTESPVVPTTEAPVPVIPTTESPVIPTTESPVAPTTEAPVTPTTESPIPPTTALLLLLLLSLLFLPLLRLLSLPQQRLLFL